MPEPTRVWLLDKSVVRRSVEGIAAILVVAPLTDRQSLAVRLLIRAEKQGVLLAISPEIANILSRYDRVLAVKLFLEKVQVLRRSRYFKRWARRLQGYGFTFEDSKLLAYGTFALDPESLLVNDVIVVTYDWAMINNFTAKREELSRRLEEMTAQLPKPYRFARLPEVMDPGKLLEGGVM